MRTRTLTVAALGAVALLPVTALAAPEPGPAVQEVKGSIAVPNPTKAGTNVTRHSRTAGLLGAPNGVTGWFFEVDPKTWGGQFALTTTTAGADLDVIFYSDPGTVDAAPTASAEHVGVDGDGEAGIVPPETTHALVYAAARPAASFAYVGHAPVEVVIAEGASLDVEVPVGGSVRWVNGTGAETFVDGGRVFRASGPIAVDGEYTATLSRTGVFTYTTSVGTGTITVTP